MNTTKLNGWYPVMFLLGCGIGGLNAWAAWEFYLRIEGSVTYLVIAAPVLALAVNIIPPAARIAWQRDTVMAMALLAAIPLCAWFLFSTSAERLHQTKAAQSAKNSAVVLASTRAEAELAEAKAKYNSMDKEIALAGANRDCQKQLRCRATLEQAVSLQDRIGKAEAALKELQSTVSSESRWKAPDWLLPSVIELLAFLFTWFGLSKAWVTRKPEFTVEQLELRQHRLKTMLERLQQVEAAQKAKTTP